MADRASVAAGARAVRLAAAFVAGVGLVVLAGWIVDIPLARSLIPDTISMKAGTAASFVLFGGGLWLVAGARAGGRAYRVGRLLGVAVTVAGALYLAEYALGVNLGIDQLVFVDMDPATAYPGRMSLPTTLAFIASGVALAAIDARPGGRWLAGYLAVATGTVGYIGLVGYALGVDVVRIVSHQSIALNTGVAFLAASLGILLARPDRGLGRLLHDPGPGPLLFRSMLPIAVVLTPVFAFARLLGEREGAFSAETGSAVFTLAMVAAILVMLLWSARSLDAVDAERRAAEDAAIAANRAKSHFLSRMSHELRTPLNAILGFAQLLELDELDDEQREGVDQILRAGRHLLDLINEVLDLSRIDTGSLSLSLEPVSVDELVADAISLVGPMGSERRISFRVQHDESATLVLADRQRARQVLVNLLSNAVKYSQPGSVTTIATERAGEGRLRIVVADTGPGIPPALLPRLFAPFDRLGEESGVIEGTGLGLALSKALVEAMGGTIGATSTVGVGSRFWFELAQAAPASAGPEATARLDVVPAPSAASGTVLYIEDNLSNLRLVERALASRTNVALRSAVLGEHGLDLARGHRPDLVLLDLHLPDMSGEDFLARLRSDPATRATPVVVLSADATPGRVDRLRASGVRAYLTKPLDVGRFLALVDDVLGPATDA